MITEVESVQQINKAIELVYPSTVINLGQKNLYVQDMYVSL